MLNAVIGLALVVGATLGLLDDGPLATWRLAGLLVILALGVDALVAAARGRSSLVSFIPSF